MNNADWEAEKNQIKKEIKSEIKLSEEDTEKLIKSIQKSDLIKDQKRVEYLGEIDNE